MRKITLSAKTPSSWTPSSWTLFSLFILFAGAGWIWLTRAAPGSTTVGQIPAPRQGFMAPDFTLLNQDGQEVTLSQLRGTPILVNIWATWCPPCKAEMPALQQVYQDYQAQGFQILGVNATSVDNRARALAFAQENNLTFPLLFDQEGRVSAQYQASSLPTSFFIDRNGLIQEVVVGGPMSPALLRIRVENLLAQNNQREH